MTDRVGEGRRFLMTDHARPSFGARSAAIKVCGGCGREVARDMIVGRRYYCSWTLRAEPVRIRRTPAWKR